MRRTGWITLVLVAAILGVLLWVSSWLASRQIAEVLRPHVQQDGSLRAMPGLLRLVTCGERSGDSTWTLGRSSWGI